MRGVFAGALAVLVLGFGLPSLLTSGGDDTWFPGGGSGQAGGQDCPLKNAQVRPEGRAQRTVLQPDAKSQARVVNFGNDRDRESASFAVVSDRPLDQGFERRLSLVADTITRTGDETAESVTFPEPTFSQPRVFGNGKRIVFAVCLAPPSDLPAGEYTALITVDGPAGVESTTVTLTANAKNATLFWVGIAGTLLLALAVLLYKAAADARATRLEAAEGEGEEKAEAGRWRWRDTVGDPGWLFPTLFALGATFGTLYALWEADPAWGASGLGSVLALAGTGLAAVGAKTIFTPSR